MSFAYIWKFLRFLILLPDDPGVRALARRLSVKRYKVYEMISLMNAKESDKFLEDLNLRTSINPC